MPRTCTACRPSKAAKVASLLDAGVPIRAIARQVSLDRHVIERHKKNGHHLTPAFVAAIAERERVEAESRDEALDRITRGIRRRTALQEERNDLKGANAGAKAEADIHLRVEEMTAPRSSIQEVHVSFAFLQSRSTRPALEVERVQEGIELASPDAGIPEIVEPVSGKVEAVESPAMLPPIDLTFEVPRVRR